PSSARPRPRNGVPRPGQRPRRAHSAGPLPWGLRLGAPVAAASELPPRTPPLAGEHCPLGVPRCCLICPRCPALCWPPASPCRRIVLGGPERGWNLRGKEEPLLVFRGYGLGGLNGSFVEDPERKYRFECHSEEQCQEWIGALRRASYEFMRRSLIFYRNEIQKVTGKDPLEQFGISEEARFQLSGLQA
uniref:Pleckstrin homology domain containing J1 n=1 Tax=Equus asinus TaxID=9793 RepID=A0A9L0IYV8_EQUAS